MLVASQSTDIFDEVRDSVGVRMVPSQSVLSKRSRPSNRMDMEPFPGTIKAIHLSVWRQEQETI